MGLLTLPKHSSKGQTHAGALKNECSQAWVKLTETYWGWIPGTCIYKSFRLLKHHQVEEAQPCTATWETWAQPHIHHTPPLSLPPRICLLNSPHPSKPTSNTHSCRRFLHIPSARSLLPLLSALITSYPPSLPSSSHPFKSASIASSPGPKPNLRHSHVQLLSMSSPSIYR